MIETKVAMSEKFENSSKDKNVRKLVENDNKFSSTCSTYLTLLGYSIGIADFWRFPFLLYRNGGGAFLIPFVIMIVVCGIPMYFLEYSISKFSGRGAYQLWDISPLFRGVGVAVSVAYGLYMIGSSIFRCWIIEFIVFAVREPIPWSHCNNEWNTPFCKDNTALVNTETNGSDTSLSTTFSNISIYSNSTDVSTAYTNVTTNVSVVATSISGTPMSAAEEFWQYQVLQLSSGVSDFSPVILRYFLYMFLFRLVILLGSWKSIKSIEKVIYVTATVPFIMTVAIFIRSLMLPGSADGIYYFFYPEFDKILKARVWIEATLMAFYTLAFGWGANLLLGSHADFKDNCLRTAIVLPIIDMLMAVFSGMVCFCVLGNMAHTYGVHVTKVINAGMATGMVAYITALTSFPLPQLWTSLFLISILLTGVDSQLIPLDMIMQLIGDLYPRARAGSRLYVLIGVSLVLFLVSLLLCNGAGAYIFLWNDWYGGAWVGPIVAFIEVVVVAWIYGMDRFNSDVIMMIGRPIPALLRVGTAFVSPIIIAVIFCTSIVEYIPPKYGSYSYPTAARILGWLIVALIMMPILTQALYILRKPGSSIVKKMKHYMKPLDTWGPCDVDKEEEFHEKKFKYNERTFRDLLYFNFFGDYPSNSAMCNILNQELKVLHKNGERVQI
ncbi:sodium- and chloride-dependent glycine transporter 1-like isoform X2 [Ruditapes philippinarum]|uniref:sodium- and chloride-dependent glycine transporter 1-like isoform X2 n=1 Tax=Ruditapes philippinarum TaxID=129788 RepID=UPI00295B5811|nr:sodium- and chloride-dependent glycine transporter 1-like isoform X2 [Ruditapes philippinarum]